MPLHPRANELKLAPANGEKEFLGCRYHQYKFIVDGKWRHDETAPFMPDPLGNVNNWLFVRRIEPAPTALNK